jgi:hypothetical protein
MLKFHQQLIYFDGKSVITINNMTAINIIRNVGLTSFILMIKCF